MQITVCYLTCSCVFSVISCLCLHSALRQFITLYDLKTTPSNNAYKPETSLALLNSTASTCIRVNNTEPEVDPITVCYFQSPEFTIFPHVFT